MTEQKPFDARGRARRGTIGRRTQGSRTDGGRITADNVSGAADPFCRCQDGVGNIDRAELPTTQEKSVLHSDSVGVNPNDVAGRTNSAEHSLTRDATGTRASRHVNRNEVEGLSCAFDGQ